MAHIFRDSNYTPCAFLIVPDGADPYDDEKTILICIDWDWPGVADRMGATVVCPCGDTDGTVDCAHRTATDMIQAAGEFIREHEGESFEGLDEYFDGR
jgi:hypothetical protein